LNITYLREIKSVGISHDHLVFHSYAAKWLISSPTKKLINYCKPSDFVQMKIPSVSLGEHFSQLVELRIYQYIKFSYKTVLLIQMNRLYTIGDTEQITG